MKAEEPKTKKKSKQKQNSKVMNTITVVLMVIAIGVFVYASYQLFSIFSEYKAGEDEYDALQEYVQVVEPEEKEVVEVSEEDGVIAANEIPSCPITVNFDALLNINSDIVGWIYIEAIPTISYPIVQGNDNDYYLTHTVEGVQNSSASIFLDYRNASDYSDSNSIIYGHNMKNQSMFGILSKLTEEETFAKSPYIWIIEPDGEEVCYQVFSARNVSEMDALYNTLNSDPVTLKANLESYQRYSEVESHEVFTGTEHIITLSTCTSNDTVRCVVQAVRKDLEDF